MNCLSLFTFLYAICAHSITSTTYPSILDMKTGECSLRSISIGDGVLVPPWREVYEERRIFDITHRYVPEMLVWDSTEGLGHHFLWLEKSMKNGSRANNSNMKVGVHTDTHVDALGHIYNNYYDVDFVVDSLDLTLLNGLTLLVDVPRDKNITTEVTKSLNIPRGVSHVLFRTLNTDRLEFHLHLGNAPKNSSLVKLGIEIP
ncbi:Cyclase-like protein 2 [Glycine max]|nr:Cyclase-like protein 2 [Glycine max]